MNNIKSTNGITLVALVITIIILLILAGISISALVGDNGIINKANKAKDETARGEIKEKLEMKVLNAQIEKSKKRRAIN